MVLRVSILIFIHLYCKKFVSITKKNIMDINVSLPLLEYLLGQTVKCSYPSQKGNNFVFLEIKKKKGMNARNFHNVGL